MATLNEIGTIDRNIDHLLAQEVDLILVVDGGSTDGTQDVLRDKPRVQMLVDETVPFRQAQTMTGMANWAGQRGADWILPIDADEFWYSPHGTLKQVLTNPGMFIADKQYVTVYHHTDWDHRFPDRKMQKVGFRWKPGVTVQMGNHECSLKGGAWGNLFCRELQFLDFDHYCRKVEERLRTLDRALPEREAAHYRVLEGLDRAELEVEWKKLVDRDTVYDPIPC